MSKAHITTLQEGHYLPLENADDVCDYLSKLSLLGWQDPSLPYAYFQPFGKDKVCLYTEVPDDLDESKAEEWLTLIVQKQMGNEDTSYQRMLPSRKYTHKPRFGFFELNPQKIDRVIYQSRHTPDIVVLGDAVDSPDYRLRHGVDTAVSSINLLIESLSIQNGKIRNFETERYLNSIQTVREDHQSSIREFQLRRERTRKLFAKRHLKLLEEEGRVEDVSWIQSLRGFSAYYKAKARFNLISSGNLQETYLSEDAHLINDEILDKTMDSLMESYQLLPVEAHFERQEIASNLKKLLEIWKELGPLCFNKSRYASAKRCYQAGLCICQILRKQDLENDPELLSQEFKCLSNLVITHRKLDSNVYACIFTEQAFHLEQEMSPLPDGLERIIKKLTFNGILANLDQYQSTPDETLFLDKAKTLLKTKGEHLSKLQKDAFAKKITELQESLALPRTNQHFEK
jgi:hypothetical protein